MTQGVAPVAELGFTHAGIPHPHEFEGDIKTSEPVHYIECTCGYNGLSREDKDGIYCVACRGRREQYMKNLSQVPEAEQAKTIDELVVERVSKVIGPLMAKIDALSKPGGKS